MIEEREMNSCVARGYRRVALMCRNAWSGFRPRC